MLMGKFQNRKGGEPHGSRLYKLMKKKILIIVGILLLILLALGVMQGARVFSALCDFFSWENPNVDDPESPYNGYILYDLHLQPREVDRTKNIKSQRQTNKNSSYGSVSYRTIVGAESEQFVCIDYSGALFSVPDPYVVQNPENYVDVLQEWDIRSVEFYVDDSKNPAVPYDEQDAFKKNDRKLLGTLSQLAVSQLQSFVGVGSGNDEYVPSEEDKEPGEPHCDFYIQINFRQSENIVWEMHVRCYEAQGAPENLVLCGILLWPNPESETAPLWLSANMMAQEQLSAEVLDMIEAYLADRAS